MHQRRGPTPFTAARPSFTAALIDRLTAFKRRVWRPSHDEIQFLEDELVELVGPDTRPTFDGPWTNGDAGELPWRPPPRAQEPDDDGTLVFTFTGGADARDILGVAHSLRSEMQRTHRTRALLDVRSVRQPLSSDAGLLLSSVLTTLLSPDCRVAVLRLAGVQGDALAGLEADGAVRIAAFEDRQRATRWLTGS